jgi:hypothetical protein
METKRAGAETETERPLRLSAPNETRLHPAWVAFIEYCHELRHGDIERLSIQDGVPVIAEAVKRKVKFKY